MDNTQGQPLTTIAQIQNALSQKRQEIGQRYASLPQTEANLRASLFGGDQTLSSLRNNEANAIKDLYNHDLKIAGNYQSPVEGFVEDPGAKARYGSQVLAEQGGVLADIQKGIANRRDVLGDALERGMKIYMYGLEGLKQEYSGLESERDFMQKQKEHEDDLALQREQMASGSTESERSSNKARAAVENEAKRGVTFKDLYYRYINELPEYEIREIYNRVNYYKKPATETSADMQSEYAKNSSKTSSTPQQKLNTGIRAIDSLNDVPDDVKKKTGSGTAYGVLFKQDLPMGVGRAFVTSGDEVALADLESKYFALTQAALTVIQGSRPSDFDVKSYQKRLGPTIQNPPAVNEDRIRTMLQLMGGKPQVKTGSGTVIMQAPDGKQYTVDQSEVAEAKKNGWRQI